MNDNQLTKPGTVFPSNVTNIKDNTENNFTITGSNVTINNPTVNVLPPQQNSVSDIEKILVQQRFSRDYYQLLVTCDEYVFTKKIISFPPNRSLCQGIVPKEIYDRCSTLEKTGIDELKTIPALVCIENSEYNGVTDPDQKAWFCYIKAIQKLGKQINVVFEPLYPIYQSVLCDRRNAVFFDLNMDTAITTLNRSMWSVHSVDIYEAFKESGISYIKPIQGE